MKKKKSTSVGTYPRRRGCATGRVTYRKDFLRKHHVKRILGVQGGSIGSGLDGWGVSGL